MRDNHALRRPASLTRLTRGFANLALQNVTWHVSETPAYSLKALAP
ncbi:MAG: hypothetical protein ACI8W8_002288 [Rhodothermales bacterium]|jgi:hypothetical protein